MNNKKKGRTGEEIARKFLENNGVTILKSNYLTKFGEIDLIGIENKTIIFIEVKLRKSLSYGLPEESINKKKLQKLQKVMDYFLSKTTIEYDQCRFDVMSILYSAQSGLYSINWLKNQDLY